MKGSKVFSRIDLKSGFNQFEVVPEHREFTTFTWKGNQYHFRGAPFGFKHLPAVFQKVLSNLFKDLDFVLVYIDDIIIFSNSFAELSRHLAMVLKILNGANLRVNRKKCTFAKTEILILGYMISEKGISVCRDKLLQIQDWKEVKTGKQIQKHLGFFNYFRELIPNYAKLFAPLERLRNAKSIQWNSEYQNIYEKAMQILSSGLVLSYPDFDQPFKVATDASNLGLGAVLYQQIHGETKYISFASRSLSESERSYGATKRELLGVIFALRKFRYYLYGKHFVLYTDHNALTFIHTQKTVNQMMQNWLEELLELDFEVVHLPGIKNILPDALSRLYDEDQPTLRNMLITHEAPNENTKGETNEAERANLLQRAHLLGHFGAEAMIKSLVRQGHFWLQMREDAVTLVKGCIPCQRYNISRTGFHPLKSIEANLPMDHLAIDLKEYPVSARGNKYCLVIIDICTRCVWLHALPNKEAITVAKALWSTMTNFGIPKIVQSDNGKEFVNKILTSLLKVAYVDHRLITAYHARANGAAERMVQTHSQAIYKIVEGRITDWDLHLPAVQLFVNIKVTKRHGSTPFSLMFARAENLFEDFSTQDIKYR